MSSSHRSKPIVGLSSPPKIGPSLLLALMLTASGLTTARAQLPPERDPPLPLELNAPKDLERWYAVPAPEVGSPMWWHAQSDVEHEWVVSLQDGRPQARLKTPKDDEPAPLPFTLAKGTYAEGLQGQRSSLKVDDGWLVGFDGGEWGGALWWFSPDGRRRLRLGDAAVSVLVGTPSGPLAFENLPRGSRAVRLAPDPTGGWTRQVIGRLRQETYAAVGDSDGSLIVLTEERLQRFAPGTGKTETLVDDGVWDSLYPNSMVIAPSGAVFAGMRHGVARIEKMEKEDEYRVTWLLPDKRIADRDKEPDRNDQPAFK